MARWNRRIVPAVVVALILSASEVRAAGAMVIQGTVRNLLGDPISGVTVDDGQGRSALTDSAGYYKIEEVVVNTYRVRASKSGLVDSSRSVDLVQSLSPVDFSLFYTVSANLDKAALSTASGANNATLTLTSYAPTPASCMQVTDTRTATTTLATYVSTNGSGKSTWTWGLSLAQNTPEGSFNLTGSAINCSTSSAVSSTRTAAYIVDNTKPLVMPQSILPRNGANAIAYTGGQPLQARVADGFGGSGLDLATIVFRLTDETASVTTTYSATWNSSTWWAKTPKVALQLGHVYTVQVQLSDRAGNTNNIGHNDASPRRGFRAISIEIASSTAAIPDTACTVSSDIGLDGMKDVTCGSVPLQVGGSSVTLSSARQGDERGWVHNTVPLATSYLRTAIAGIEQPHARAYGDASTSEIKRSFRVESASATSVTYPVTSTVQQMGNLSTKVPGTWTTASIVMPALSVVGTSEACSDSTITGTNRRAPHCSSDPVGDRYLAISREGVSQEAAIQKVAAMGLVTQDADVNLEVSGPLSAAQALFNDAAMGAVQALGQHDIVDAWGETKDGICVSSMLLTNVSAIEESGPSGVNAYSHSLSEGSCELALTAIIQQPPDGLAFQCSVSDPDSCLPCQSGCDPDPPCTAGSAVGSGSHRVHDYTDSFDVAWLRSMHKVEWDAQCRVRWADGSNYARSVDNDGTCWWATKMPVSVAIEWGWQTSQTKMIYNANFESREPLPGQKKVDGSDCKEPIVFPPSWIGYDCDVIVWASATGAKNAIAWSTVQRSLPAQGKASNGRTYRGGSCSTLQGSGEDSGYSNSYWYGDPDDLCVKFTSSGDVSIVGTKLCT
ncbi:MAG: carboxypeptidase regulatory-like domain-containing protein [Actinomycetota bacterium]